MRSFSLCARNMTPDPARQIIIDHDKFERRFVRIESISFAAAVAAALVALPVFNTFHYGGDEMRAVYEAGGLGTLVLVAGELFSHYARRQRQTVRQKYRKFFDAGAAPA